MLKKFLNKVFGKPKEDTFCNMSVVKLQRDDIMSFKEAFELTNKPIITFYKKETKYNFILDTGCTDAVIDSNVVKQMDYKLVNMQSNLFGMEGNTKLVQICELTLYFNNRGYTYNYLINDMSQAFKQIKESTGVTVHGIIGSKFFNKFKYVLDFDELIAYSKK